MAKRTRKQRRQRRKRTTRRLRGGDYRQFTSETAGGTPVTHDATVLVPGKGLLTLQEFRELKENY